MGAFDVLIWIILAPTLISGWLSCIIVKIKLQNDITIHIFALYYDNFLHREIYMAFKSNSEIFQKKKQDFP